MSTINGDVDVGKQHLLLAIQQGAVMQRPTISPYIVESVTLRIGPARKKYFVSSSLLQNQTWIDSSRSRIELPDIDENTGHILVHYLYTGTYQTLDNIEDSAIEGTHVEFKRAFSAYIMANTYQLAGLQQLAMFKIEYFGGNMTVSDIVTAIDKDFSRLPESAVGFEEYLMAKARNAFEKDHTVFLEDGTFDRINSVALGKILAKCVLQLYKDKVAHMLQVEGSPGQSSEKRAAVVDAEANEMEVRSDSEVRSDKPQEQVATDEASVHAGQAAAVDDGNSYAPTGKKKKGKKGLIQDLKDEVPPPPSPEPQLVSEIEPLQDGIPPTLLEPEPVPKPEPVLVDDLWAFSFGASSKGKKKKGKKGLIQDPKDEVPPLPSPEPQLVSEIEPLQDGIPPTLLELEPVPEPEPVLVDDPWAFSFSASSKGKKKKKKEAVEEPPPPPPEPEPVAEPEPIKEEDLWGFGIAKKKKKTGVSLWSEPPAEPEQPAEPAPIEEQPPAPESAKAEDPWGSWAAPTAVPKKKKKKKAASELPVEPEPPVEPAPVEEQQALPALEPANVEDSWGSSATPSTTLKKKKKKGKVALEPPSPPEPELAPEIEQAQADVPSPLPLMQDPSPVPEQVNGEGPSTIWGATTSFKKKKKKAKAIVEEPQIEKSLSPPPEPNGERKDDLSPPPEMVVEKQDDDFLSKKERKRLIKIANDREQLRVEGQVVVDSTAKIEGESAPVTVGDLERAEAKVAPPRKGAEVCPALVEHFSESGGWRGCSTCRAWVGQANAELALTR